MRAPLIAVLLALLAVPAHALPPPCSSGQVFEDRNGNGLRDAGEPGIPGVFARHLQRRLARVHGGDVGQRALAGDELAEVGMGGGLRRGGRRVEGHGVH